MQFGILYDSLFTHHKFFQFLKYLNLNFMIQCNYFPYFCLINKIETQKQKENYFSNADDDKSC